MRAVDHSRTLPYGRGPQAPLHRRAAEPLTRLDGARAVHRYVRVAPLGSRLPPLGLVSDTACPPQLKGYCSTARGWASQNRP